MTISSTVSRADYVGTGAVTVYPYPFLIFAATDLEVVSRDSDDVETTLTYLTDYSVDGVGDAAGGDVTLVTALPTGEFLTVLRVPPVVQTTSLRNQGTFFPTSYESALDYQTMVSQYLLDRSTRAMTLPITIDPDEVSVELPTPVADYALVWNSDGTALVNGASAAGISVPGDGRTVQSVSTYLDNNALFNVLDYGAVRDGVTDDTAAFQRALTKAGDNGGGIVYVPTGDYAIETLTYTYTALQVPENVTMRGEGVGSNLIADVTRGVVGVIGSSATVEDIQISGTSAVGIYITNDGVAIRRNTISGATLLMPFNYGAGIEGNSCEDLTIEDNFLFENGNHALSGSESADIFINGLNSNAYKRTRIIGNKCFSTDVLYNIVAYNVQDSVIALNECTGAFCRTADNSGYGILVYLPGGSAAGSVSDNQIINNYCHDLEGSGIYIQGALRTFVDGNELRNVSTVQAESGLPSGGIALNVCLATVITNNRIYTSGRSGIRVGPTSDGGLIEDNVIWDAAGVAGICFAGPTTGIRTIGNDIVRGNVGIGSVDSTCVLTDIVVLGNRIASCSTAGIQLHVPTGCTVSSNTVRLSGTKGIWVLGDGKNNVVSANNVSDSSQTTPNDSPNIYVQSPGTTLTGNIAGNRNPVAYDAAHPYKIGEYALSGGIEYLCIANVPIPAGASAPPNATYWSVSSLAWSGATAYSVAARVIANSLLWQAITANTNNTPLATAYSLATNYVANDFAYYLGTTYKCILLNGPASTIHTPPNATYWTPYWGLVGGAYGILVDTAGGVGSVAVGNKAQNSRTMDLSFPAGMAALGNVNSIATGISSFGTRIQLVGQGNFGTQVEYGSIALTGSAGTVESTGDTFMATNAKQGTDTSSGGTGTDIWQQTSAGIASVLLVLPQAGGLALYVAPIGSADATFATFWGTAKWTVNAAGALILGGGTALTKAVVYSASLTPASCAAATSAEQTFTVTGLTTADKIVLNGPAPTAGTGIVNVRVSAADTLAITWSNSTAGALTPAAGTYPVLAFRS